MSDSNQNVEAPLIRLRVNKIWSSEMTRALLDCVDDAAGEDTIFLTDRDAATAKVKAALQPITHSAIFSTLTEAKIFNKLEHQCRDAGRPPGGFTAFLQLGTKSVNLSKLQAGAYSQAETDAASARKKRSENKPSNTINTTNTKRKRKIEVESESESESETEYEHIGRTVKKLFAMLTGDHVNTKKHEKPSSKRAKLSRLTGSSHGKTLRQTSTRRKRNVINTASRHVVADSQDSDDEAIGARRGAEARIDDDDDVSYSPEHATSASKMEAGPKVVFICEICDQQFHVKKLLQTHKLLHKQYESTKNTIPSSSYLSDTTPNARRSVEELTSPDLGTFVEAAEPLDVDVIKSEMVTMQTEIFDSTTLFLSSLKIDSNEIISLRFGSYEDSLKELLRTVFGSRRIDQPVHSEDASSPASAIKRREIILAIIGCAVTEWALIPPPQGMTQDGILEEVKLLLEAQSPSFQNKTMGTATRRYLEKHVKPFAKGVASVLAEDLYHLLRHFLPVALQANGSASHRPAFPSSEAADTAPRHSKESSRWPLMPHQDPTRKFLESLQSVFESTLNLRLDMEMKGHTEYKFRFLQSGTIVDLTQVIILNKLNNKKIPDPDSEGEEASTEMTGRMILIGLTPIVTRTRKGAQSENGEQDRVLVSKGCVHVHEVSDHVNIDVLR